jgi:hypothetical protein
VLLSTRGVVLVVSIVMFSQLDAVVLCTLLMSDSVSVVCTDAIRKQSVVLTLMQ